MGTEILDPDNPDHGLQTKLGKIRTQTAGPSLSAAFPLKLKPVNIIVKVSKLDSW